MESSKVITSIDPADNVDLVAFVCLLYYRNISHEPFLLSSTVPHKEFVQ